MAARVVPRKAIGSEHSIAVVAFQEREQIESTSCLRKKKKRILTQFDEVLDESDVGEVIDWIEGGVLLRARGSGGDPADLLVGATVVPHAGAVVFLEIWGAFWETETFLTFF